MFLNVWSLALSLLGLLAVLLVIGACRTGWRVLRYWDPASDQNRQIRLESEIWLSSTLVAYALGFQIVSLLLLVLAADDFCQVIAGAMCATGALLANRFGMPALLVKLAGVFFYGFWIVLHQLDIRSPSYPLVRGKYLYLLALLPLLLVDFSLQTLYLARLKPDIITSCCAVVFASPGSGDGRNLLSMAGTEGLLWPAYYATILLLLGLGGWLLRQWRRWVAVGHCLAWLWFLVLALVVITMRISSYVYAMPYHHCPFCLLKPEYHFIGYAFYGALLPAAFLGMASGLVEPLRGRAELRPQVVRFQVGAVRLALALLAVLALLTSYYPLRYLLVGGE